MEIEAYAVNAFVLDKDAFSGNPAGVCLDMDMDRSWSSDDVMQKIAMQMNLSETSFIRATNNNKLELRWFTPECEVPLCGHGTLAAAAALKRHCSRSKNDTDYFKDGCVTFHTKSGELRCSRPNPIDKPNVFALNFPRYEFKVIESSNESAAVLQVCDILERMFSVNCVKEVLYVESAKKLVTVLDASKVTPSDLAKAEIDSLLLKAVDVNGEFIRGVSVTLCGNSEPYDFYSRYFAPWVGINEDPVNGSSHCALTPYWCYVLNKTHLRARMLSKRGGDLHVSMDPSDPNRVVIAGNTHVFLEGSIFL